jgi:hypothetical protein
MKKLKEFLEMFAIVLTFAITLVTVMVLPVLTIMALIKYIFEQ